MLQCENKKRNHKQIIATALHNAIIRVFLNFNQVI